MGLLDDIDVDESEVIGTVEDAQAEPSPEDKELVLKFQVNELKAQMDAVVIKDQAEYDAACEWLKAVKKKAKEVEAFYEPDKKHYYGIYKEIMAKTKSLTDILSVCEKGVKSKIKDYADAERKKKEEAQKKEEEARAKAAENAKEDDPDGIAYKDPMAGLIAPSATPSKKVGENTAGVVLATVWKWKISDESAIPREYFLLDESKINGVVRAMKGDTKIPGIEVYEDTQVRG